ncbi:hypothetical protein Bca4012_079042 [Brassica carinata]
MLVWNKIFILDGSVRSTMLVMMKNLDKHIMRNTTIFHNVEIFTGSSHQGFFLTDEKTLKSLVEKNDPGGIKR